MRLGRWTLEWVGSFDSTGEVYRKVSRNFTRPLQKILPMTSHRKRLES